MLKPYIPPAFYNTINTNNPQLDIFKAAAATQEQRVLDYYQKEKRATALQVAEKLGMHESSCRRCVTNLYKAGRLRKTETKVIEKYGKPNYIFELI